MNRRQALAGLGGLMLSGSGLSSTHDDGSRAPAALSDADWKTLDDLVKSEWPLNLGSATEEAIRRDTSGELLFLPFPYESPTPAGSEFQNMFGWDTDFVSRALMVHGLANQARNHILNYLFMIDRYGYMPNANAVGYLTRSEPPLIADTIWRYFLLTRDRDLLHLAYPRLKRNYQDYWNAPHHQTPVGLATNHDSGDPSLAPRLAAEAETGLDWTPIYGGDVRRCVPLITNCTLVRYANCLAQIAREVGEEAESKSFSAAAAERSARIRQYCWSETLGFFVEYDFMSARQLPCLSDCALWTLWAGVATQDQAATLVRSLGRIEQRFGLSCTDKSYPTPDPKNDYGPPEQIAPDGKALSGAGPKAVGGTEPLQWMYPAGWAPSQVIAVEGLDAYGYNNDAKRIATKFLRLLMNQHRLTGHLWEKYNVVNGGVELPNSRYGNLWMRGWTAAAVALLGRRLFRQASFQTI